MTVPLAAQSLTVNIVEQGLIKILQIKTLQQLCMEAALQCIRDQMGAINFDKDRVALRRHPGAGALKARLQRHQHCGDLHVRVHAGNPGGQIGGGELVEAADVMIE